MCSGAIAGETGPCSRSATGAASGTLDATDSSAAAGALFFAASGAGDESPPSFCGSDVYYGSEGFFLRHFLIRIVTSD